jgi:hypothetical protein
MPHSDRDADGPGRPPAGTPRIPRRPKDVPPWVSIDPVGQVVAELLPVTITGSANPGITWFWNPRIPEWEPRSMVTYASVQVTTGAGLTVDATPVGTDWAPWSAEVRQEPRWGGQLTPGSCQNVVGRYSTTEDVKTAATAPTTR